jgi:glycosyltransferase involved in cell wall biosynthesis
MSEASVGVETAVAGASKRAHVSIAICTRDRPLFLERCVRSLFAMTGLDRIEPELLVVENAETVSAAAARLVEAAPKPWRAWACAEPRIGIPFARNRAVDAAVAHGVDALVFVDDDQTVPPEWLATLLEVQAETGADAVQSALNYVFEQRGPHDAYVATGFQGRDGVDVVGAGFLGTGGVLITRGLIADWGLRFDERAPLAGGEDTRFFLDATAFGAKLVVTGRTSANEHCPPAKQRLGWILRRQRRLGYVQVVRRFKDRSRGAWLRHGAWRVARGTLWLPLVAVHRPSRTRELMRIAKGVGVVQALLGRDMREYERPLGR